MGEACAQEMELFASLRYLPFSFTLLQRVRRVKAGKEVSSAMAYLASSSTDELLGRSKSTRLRRLSSHSAMAAFGAVLCRLGGGLRRFAGLLPLPLGSPSSLDFLLLICLLCSLPPYSNLRIVARRFGDRLHALSPFKTAHDRLARPLELSPPPNPSPGAASLPTYMAKPFPSTWSSGKDSPAEFSLPGRLGANQQQKQPSRGEA